VTFYFATGKAWRRQRVAVQQVPRNIAAFFFLALANTARATWPRGTLCLQQRILPTLAQHALAATTARWRVACRRRDRLRAACDA